MIIIFTYKFGQPQIPFCMKKLQTPMRKMNGPISAQNT